MSETTRRGARDCALYGLLGGSALWLMEEGYGAFMGFAPLPRMFGTPIVGGLAFLVLSAALAALYGFVNGRFNVPTRTNLGSQVGLGTVLGIALWVTNLLAAALLYPAFLGTRQFVQVAMHVALYGIPVALLYARAEQEIEHRRGSPLVA